MKTVNKYLDEITSYYKDSEEVYMVLLSGSHQENQGTPISDIDIRIVCYNESDVEKFLNNITSDMREMFDITGWNRPIFYHFFFYLSEGIQLDTNVVSQAQYYSLTSKLDCLLKNQHTSEVISNDVVVPNIEDLIRSSYAQLQRAMPKILKKKYIVATRFFNNLRESNLIQLLGVLHMLEYKNKVNIQLHDELLTSNLFNQLYCSPETESLKTFLKNTNYILQKVSQEYNLEFAFEDEYQQVNTFISNME